MAPVNTDLQDKCPTLTAEDRGWMSSEIPPETLRAPGLITHNNMPRILFSQLTVYKQGLLMAILYPSFDTYSDYLQI